MGGNYQPFIADYARQSADAVAKTTALGAQWSQHHYGSQNPHNSQTLRLCVPAQNDACTDNILAETSLPPLLMFIHGGYWQELSAADSLFAALGCVQHGAAFSALDYTLAPHASVAQMVDECCAALAFLTLHATDLGFDARRIVLAGSSAGAHLAAMVALRGSQQGYQLRGAVLVSGIYELEPLIDTTINQALGLTASTAQTVSPALLSTKNFPPTVLCYGAIETAEFKRQSQQFADQLRRESPINAAIATFEVTTRNHFDVIMDLTNPHTLLGQATFNLLNSVKSPH